MNGIEIKRFCGKKPQKAFVFTGGRDFCAEKMTDIPASTDLVIAADSGCELLAEFSRKVKNITPDVILGDMDSFSEKEAKKLFPDARFVPFPPEKDDTDTGLAVDMAINFGCTEIVVVGGLGGRLDHTLSNLFLLEDIRKKGAIGVITDGKNRAYLAKEENVFKTKERKYLSLIPVSEKLSDVVIDENFKYPYRADSVERSRFVTTSNEILRLPAKILVGGGTALVVESGD